MTLCGTRVFFLKMHGPFLLCNIFNNKKNSLNPRRSEISGAGSLKFYLNPFHNENLVTMRMLRSVMRDEISFQRPDPSPAKHCTKAARGLALIHLCSFSPRTAGSVPSTVPIKMTVGSEFGSGAESAGLDLHL